jgi:hypothetical protein
MPGDKKLSVAQFALVEEGWDWSEQRMLGTLEARQG